MSVSLGWEPDCFELAVGSTWDTRTTSTYRDTTYTPNLCLVAHSGTREYSLAFTSASNFWFRGYIRIDAINSTLGNGLVIFRNGTTNQLRLRPENVTDGPAKMRLYRWNGSSWDIVGGDNDYFYLAAGSAYTFVIHVQMHATTGTFRVYLNQTIVLDITGNVTGPSTSCDNVVLGGMRTDNNQANWSQIAVADFCLIASNVANYSPTAAGTYSEFSGAYTALDEADYSLADSVDTNSSGDRFTFNFANTTGGQSGSSRVIRAMQVAARIELDAGSVPTAVRAMVRTGSNDYESGSIPLTADDVDRSIKYTWELNPNTAALWTFGNIDSLEAGFKSV